MDRIECTQPGQLSDRKTVRTSIPISTTDHTDDTDEDEARESFSLMACWSDGECILVFLIRAIRAIRGRVQIMLAVQAAAGEIPISTTDNTDDTDEDEARESFSLMACWSDGECILVFLIRAIRATRGWVQIMLAVQAAAGENQPMS